MRPVLNPILLAIGGLVVSAGLVIGDEIHEAAEGDLARVKTLLEKNPDLIHSVDDLQRTPLHRAARFADKEMVAYLLSKGAKVNATAYNRFTPLHYTDDPQIAKLLIAHGADLKARAASGTPLEAAVAQENFALIEVFLEAGEKLDFNSLVRLDRTKEVKEALKERPWLAKAPREGLNQAVWKGNLELIEAFLEAGADPNFDKGAGFRSGRMTALSSALMAKNLEAVELLFKHGAAPNVFAYVGKMEVGIVHYAIGMQDIRFLRLILKNGGEVNTWGDYGGLTPLHAAAQGGDLEKVKLLLEHKARINADAGDGVTPLFAAAMTGTPEMCAFLLSKGATLDIYTACALGKRAEVEAMLRTDPKLATLPDKRLKREPLFYAARGGDVEIAQLLIEKGANVNARGPEYAEGSFQVFIASTAWEKNVGETPLHVACRRGSLGVARLLLDRGALLEAGDNDLKTPLHMAVERGQAELVGLLLERKADVNARARNEWTPVTYAASGGDPGIMSALLATRPSPSTLTEALSAAIAYNPKKKEEIVGLLRIAGAQADLKTACALGDRVRVEELLAADPALLQKDHGRDDPLRLAAGNGHRDLAEFLIEKGAQVEGPKGQSPLRAAAGAGHLSVVKLLLSKGANVEARDYRGTALFDAAKNDHVEVVEYLLGKKADLRAVDSSRGSVLHHAADGEALRTIRFLIEKGLPVDLRNKYGSTPLHGAAGSGRSKAVALLLELSADPMARNHQGQTPLQAAEKGGSQTFGDEKRDLAGVLKILRAKIKDQE